MSTTKIKVEITTSTDIKKAWNYYTLPEHIVNWNFANDDWCCPKTENDLKVGGTYKTRMEAKDGSFGFDFEAVYDEVILHKKITYSLADGRQSTTTFESTNGNTLITTVFDAEIQNPIEQQKQGWQAILDNYKNYLESK